MFIYCKKMNFDIVCMQETHSTETDCQVWLNLWKGAGYFCHGDQKSRGTAILFKPGLNVEINKVTKSEKGRYIMLDAVINEKEMVLVNVYGPNEDDPTFFMDLFDKMSCHKYADRVIVGDFNLVIDEQIDSLNRKNNNNKALKVLKMSIDELMLCDPWRERNGNKFQYT